MCLKTPMDIDTDDKDLEVLMAFSGSVTQGHYVTICKYIPYIPYYLYAILPQILLCP